MSNELDRGLSNMNHTPLLFTMPIVFRSKHSRTCSSKLIVGVPWSRLGKLVRICIPVGQGEKIGKKGQYKYNCYLPSTEFLGDRKIRILA